MKMQDWFTSIDHMISEGSKYLWHSFGKNAYTLDAEVPLSDYETTMIFDTKTHIVYQCMVYDYSANLAYRYTNPDFLEGYREECKARRSPFEKAWDDVNYIDLDEKAFIEKLSEIWDALK